MTELIRAGQGVLEEPQLSADIFQSFIDFTDRPESTTRTYITNLKQFRAWMLYAGIIAPERKDIISYRNYLSAEHDAIQLDPETPQGWSYRTDSTGNRIRITCKPSTVKLYLQSVKQFFRWTAAAGLYNNIADNIHAPKVSTAHKKDSFTPEDIQTLEAYMAASALLRAQKAAAAEKDTAGRKARAEEQEKRLRAMFLLAVTAGLRCCEISRANLKDLQQRNGRSYLYIYGKGHSEADQIKPIAAEVKNALSEYLACRTGSTAGTAPIFTATGNRSRGKRLAPTTISTILKQSFVAAGYDSERLTAHSLRHTAGQNVLEITGNNIYLTQQYLRHANPATTEIYLSGNVIEADADIAERLYKHYHSTQDSHQETLEDLAAKLNPAQRQRLADVIRTMI